MRRRCLSQASFPSLVVEGSILDCLWSRLVLSMGRLQACRTKIPCHLLNPRLWSSSWRFPHVFAILSWCGVKPSGNQWKGAMRLWVRSHPREIRYWLEWSRVCMLLQANSGVARELPFPSDQCGRSCHLVGQSARKQRRHIIRSWMRILTSYNTVVALIGLPAEFHTRGS